MWKETTEKEHNLRIYNEEIRDFIPDRLLDFHVHVFDENIIPDGDPGFELPGLHIKSYTVPELLDDMAKVFPGKDYSAVVFGFPEMRYDSDKNNRYVLQNGDYRRIFPFRLLRPDEDPDKVQMELKRGPFLGIKPYLNYVRGKDVQDVEINDMLPRDIMEIINRLGLMIMLHVPRQGRLADPVNQKQIVELAKDYPNATIILAHVGRAYYLSNIVGHLKEIRQFENIYCDVSMVNHPEVLEYLFQHFEHRRLLYGTDLPIAICGGKSIEINDQYTYVTSKPWFLSISDDHGKIVFTSFIYEQIRAIKRAVGRVKPGHSFIDDLFYKNGKDLINKVTSSLGGVMP
jgi:predicted TIM-barrel fold metal-dependent hydrolase